MLSWLAVKRSHSNIMRWPVNRDPHTWRTSSPLRPGLGFRYTHPGRWWGFQDFVLKFSYKRLRSLWWRWHPLEVGNILWRLVPCGPTLCVDDGLSGKPIVLVETSHRYAYYTGPP